MGGLVLMTSSHSERHTYWRGHATQSRSLSLLHFLGVPRGARRVVAADAVIMQMLTQMRPPVVRTAVDPVLMKHWPDHTLTAFRAFWIHGRPAGRFEALTTV